MNDKLSGKELEHAIENRKAARQMALNAAIKGNAVCGAMFAMESMASDAGLGFLATTAQEYSDDDDDIRPF